LDCSFISGFSDYDLEMLLSMTYVQKDMQAFSYRRMNVSYRKKREFIRDRQNSRRLHTFFIRSTYPRIIKWFGL